MEWVGPLLGSLLFGGVALLLVVRIKRALHRDYLMEDNEDWIHTSHGRHLPKDTTKW